jgi:hypothetical protein
MLPELWKKQSTYTTKEFAHAKANVDGVRHGKSTWIECKLKKIMMITDNTDTMFLHVGNIEMEKNLSR